MPPTHVQSPTSLTWLSSRGRRDMVRIADSATHVHLTVNFVFLVAGRPSRSLGNPGGAQADGTLLPTTSSPTGPVGSEDYRHELPSRSKERDVPLIVQLGNHLVVAGLMNVFPEERRCVRPRNRREVQRHATNLTDSES